MDLMDEYRSADLTLIAQVPTRGVKTIYSRLGDWFAWLSVATIFVLMGFAFREARGPVSP